MRDNLTPLVDIERALRDPQYCHDAPDTCDLCGTSFEEAEFLVDGEAKDTTQISLPDGRAMGQWAYMCAKCFADYGVGIKWGRGQLYKQIEKETWLLVAGFPPDE